MAAPTNNAIKASEHVFVAGMTGSGKSELTRNYLAQFPSVAMLDIKGDAVDAIARGENPWPQVEAKKLTIVTRVAALEEVTTPYIIYSPEHDEMDLEHYDLFFKWCYYKRNITVWVDEAMEVSPNPHVLPPFYKAILTRGRSRNVAAWSLTQRPAGLSQMIFSQSTHFFVFDLQLADDRARVAKATGMPAFKENPGEYTFWYFKNGQREVVKARLALPKVTKGGEKHGG